MKIAVSAKIYDRMSLREVVENSVRIGYDGIEFRDNAEQLPVDTPMEVVRKLKKHLRDAGIAATSIASFTGQYTGKTGEECQKELEDFRKHVQMAAELGAYNVRHWPAKFGIPSGKIKEEDFACAVEWTAKACDIASEYGIKVAMELHHNCLQDTTRSSLKLYYAVGRENFAFTPDNQNYYFDREPFVECIEQIGKDKICNVHLKDAVELTAKVAPAAYEYNGKYYVFRPINEGGVDQYASLDALKRIGYDSYVTVESSELLTPLKLAEHEYKEVVKIMEYLNIARG